MSPSGKVSVQNTWVLRVPKWENESPDGAVIPEEHPILSFSHGMWTPSAPQSEPEIQDLSLVLRAGPALPAFMSACVNRRTLGRVVLELREDRGREPGLEIVYELINARVASIRPGGNASSNERPLYELALCFDEMKVKVEELSWSAQASISHGADV